MLDLKTILVIGCGGFIGAILRAFFMEFVGKFFTHNINYGTLFVNIIGSFLLGILMFYYQNKEISHFVKYFLNIGFLGAFTTFSTFSLENLTLLQNGLLIHLILNVLLNVGLCIFAIWCASLVFK